MGNSRAHEGSGGPPTYELMLQRAGHSASDSRRLARQLRETYGLTVAADVYLRRKLAEAQRDQRGDQAFSRARIKQQRNYHNDVRVIKGMDRIVARYHPDFTPQPLVEALSLLKELTHPPVPRSRGGQMKPRLADRAQEVAATLKIDPDEARQILRQFGIRIPTGRKPRRP